MKYYPVFLVLRDRPCLIAGGGEVAERKALALLAAGADITIVSPTLTPKLADLARVGKITHRARPFEERDIAGMQLVVAATNSLDVNTFVGRECRKRHVLVNVAAPPEESSFIVPSTIERGDLVLAISTGGDSPGLAKRIRQDLERQFGPEYGQYAELLAGVRKRLQAEVADEGTRKDVLDAVLDSDVLFLLKNGEAREADRRVNEILRRFRT